MKKELSATRVLGAVALGLMLALVIKAYVVDLYTIVGTSMNPSFYEGNRVVVLKCMYSLQRGDVIVLHSPDEDMILLKRVVGLPGEEIIAWEDGAVSIQKPNDEVFRYIEEPYRVRGRGGYDLRCAKIPEGCYWVMGDNRPVSKDSREIGPIPAHLILGKVVWSF